MGEREIDLFDLLLEVMLRWRVVIVCMLVFGVLLGGYSYWKSSVNAALAQSENGQIENEQIDDTLSDEEKLVLLEDELTEKQRENVETVFWYENIYKQYMETAAQSVVLQMDAEAVSFGNLVIGIEADDAEVAASIADAYVLLVNGDALFAYLNEKMPAIIKQDVSRTVYAQDGGSEINQVMTVTVKAPDDDACRLMTNAVKQYLSSVDLSSVFGDYEMKLVRQTYFQARDEQVLQQQLELKGHVVLNRQNFENAADALVDQEREYYELLFVLAYGVEPDTDSEEVADFEEAPVAPTRATISIKYVCVGLVIGAFLYAFLIALLYILSNKLRFCDDVASLYGIALLGQIPCEKKQKKFLGFIDKWLWTLKARGKRQFSAEEATRLTAVAVKMEADKADLKNVYCIGCDLKQGAAPVCDGLAAVLKGSGIEVQSIDNVLYDAEARERLQNASAVVLVEKAGVSMYQEIAEELALLKRQKIAVLGAVVVE